MSELCKFLPWDSEHFGKRIAQVTATTVTAETLFDIIDWCSGEKIDCLYFLADLDDKTAELVRREGFQMVDIRVTLDHSLENVLPWSGLRTAGPEHIPALQQMRRFEDSRFYHDSHFPRELVDRMFDKWIENAVTAGLVIIAQDIKRPVGYVACRIRGGLGLIELIAVDPDISPRGGLATVLTSAALARFAAEKCAAAEVMTQGRNIAAQRIYQLVGFRTGMVQVWYLKWFGERPQNPSDPAQDVSPT